MRTPICALGALIAMQGMSTAQIVIRRGEAARKQERVEKAPASSEHDHLFYKAYFLEKGERKLPQAIELYRKFLTKASKSGYAPRAANFLVNCLNRANRLEAAREVREKYGELLAMARRRRGAEGDAAGRRRRGEGGFGGRGFGGRGFGGRGQGGAGGAQRIAALESQIERVQNVLAREREAGNTDRVAELEKRIARLKKQVETAKSGGQADAPRRRRGGEGRERRGGQEGRRGRRRGFMRPLTEMTKDEREQWIERMDGFIERIADRAETDEQAEKILGNFKKLKKLISSDKIKEAEKLREKLFRSFRRRRR